MTKNTRKKYQPEEKVSILRKHLLEGESVSDVCDAYEVNPTVFYRWQQEFFEHGAAAFDRARANAAARQERQTREWEAKLQKKDHVIAEIMGELIAQKKGMGNSERPVGTARSPRYDRGLRATMV